MIAITIFIVGPVSSLGPSLDACVCGDRARPQRRREERIKRRAKRRTAMLRLREAAESGRSVDAVADRPVRTQEAGAPGACGGDLHRV
jgi:hypothetical protein